MSNFEFSTRFNGIADVFLRKPEYYKPLLQFLENVMVNPSPLSKIERELIAAYVSKLNGCHFCVAAHKATLKHLGAQPEVIAGIDADLERVDVSSQLRALIPFIKRLTENPKSVTRSHIVTLRHAGLEEDTIEDAMNVVALFCQINRLVDATGVKGGDTYFEHVGRALALNGYAKLLG